MNDLLNDEIKRKDSFNVVYQPITFGYSDGSSETIKIVQGNLMWIVKCSLTDEYLIASKSKKIDQKDIDFAKRYSKSGAKTAASYYNNAFKEWKKMGISNCDRNFVPIKFK